VEPNRLRGEPSQTGEHSGASHPSLLELAGTELAGLLASFYTVALALIAIVVAVPVFLITGLGLVVLTTAIGAQGTLAAALSIGWFIVFIGGTTVAVARVVRWLRPLTRKVESIGVSASPDVVQVASVQNVTSPDQRRTPSDQPDIWDRSRHRQFFGHVPAWWVALVILAGFFAVLVLGLAAVASE
jgi:hypothetical protein